MKQKLELGCGDRPTPGYLHQDIIELVPLDFLMQPWEINLPDNSLSEVIALGVMEHLRFEDFKKTVAHMHKLLEPGGIFLFDVPDLLVWSRYLYDVLRDKPVPFEKQHILNTIWGWQRWLGDEHKSGWTGESITDVLLSVNFHIKDDALKCIKDRGIIRNRFSRPEDAHIYIKAVK
jgi:predicted SAM-dependent methyltransferase